MEDSFMQEKLDGRRFMLLNIKKIWQICLGAVIGACFFGCVYYLKTNVLAGEPLFRAQTLYMITFNRDQVDSIHDYYNDYTWNDVLDSDQIAGRAAEKLGDISKEEVAAAVSIPTMSDIRFIWVYADMETKEAADRVEAAIGDALQEFALETDGFTEIAIWDQKETEQIREKSLIGRMIIAGAVVGALVTCFFVYYDNLMDDSAYTEQDVKDMLGIDPAGVIMRAGKKEQPEFFRKELQHNLKELLKKTEKNPVKVIIYPLDPECGLSMEESAQYLKELLTDPDKDAVVEMIADNAAIGDAENSKTQGQQIITIALLPYGQKNGARLKLAWKDAQLKNKLPDAVVIFDAQEWFYRNYYKI
ncbi:MAG: hypothetical protein ACI4DW_09845 [Lachnospiraceae bacterium]